MQKTKQKQTLRQERAEISPELWQEGKEACVNRKTGGGTGDEDAEVHFGNIEDQGWEQQGQHTLGVLEVKQRGARLRCSGPSWCERT